MAEPSASAEASRVNTDWIAAMFLEAGVVQPVAAEAAVETLKRILRRQRPYVELARRPRSSEFSANLVRDPLVSLSRILGLGDEQLPFVQEDGTLSPISFSEVLSDLGMEAVVALSYAKVIHAAFEPRDLYQPLWELLGREGPVCLEELGRLDFEPLRACWTELEITEAPRNIEAGRARAEEIRAIRHAPPTHPSRPSHRIAADKRPKRKP